MFNRKVNEEILVEQPIDQPATAGVSPADAALRDELGLYQLWYLELRLTEELARAARTESVFSLAAWQLRVLPGETPHPDLIQQAANLITGSLRSYDIPSRIDDTRFVAILFDAEQAAASTLAFRIKGDLQIRVRSAGKWQAGVATLQRDGLDGDTLISATLRRLEEDARAA